MSAIAVAPAGALEAELLAALHAATIGADPAARGVDSAPWSAVFVARLLSLPGAFAEIARAPNPVGFVLCLPAGDAIDIAAIGVVSIARRAGVGRRLLAAAAAEARARGAQRLMLEVAADNAGAVALYRAVGFTDAGRRPGYYTAAATSPQRDALVLRRNL